MMRINELRKLTSCETTFDEWVVLPNGQVDFDPYLTTHISYKQLEKLYRGVEFGNSEGRVLNAFVTIAWKYAGEIEHGRIGELTGLFTERLRKHCEEQKIPCMYVYVHENSKAHGLHTHLLIHMPKAREVKFVKWAIGCVTGITGHSALPRQTIDVQLRRDTEVNRQWVWFQYMMKGVPDAHLRFEDGSYVSTESLVRHQVWDTGRVQCRYRANVSRNLDIAATKKKGFASSLDRADLNNMYTAREWELSQSPVKKLQRII